jgi:hypothetical protein
MIGKPKNNVRLAEILKNLNEMDILSRYLGISKLPCVISSPLRKDSNPSFGIYTKDGVHIKWRDFSTREGGSIFELLTKYWNCDLNEVVSRILTDFPDSISASRTKNTSYRQSESRLECKVRSWQKHDIEYWESYGVPLKWLKYAEVYPISHKIVLQGDKKYIFGAEKYAYAFVERKEGKVTLKIYQPFADPRNKWYNKHDKSVISLWTKIPQKGERIVICSSLKDALCLWANTGIPAIAVQGEGYPISETAVKELTSRFNKVFILFDNDEAGVADSLKLSAETGFLNLTLPPFKEGKDASDLYKAVGKQRFKEIIMYLFEEKEELSDLPFYC